MTKMTYVNAIDDVLALIVNFDETYVTFHDDDLGTSHDRTVGEVREKLEALKVSLEKRASHKTSSPSKTQRENEVVKVNILDTLLKAEAPMQCKAIAETLGISGQKCSALLKQLVDAEKVEKIFEKKVAFFKVVEE